MLKWNSKIDCILLISLLFITAIIFNACAYFVAPIKPESIVIENQSGIHLPANARLAIHMESSQLYKTYTVPLWVQPYKFQLDEGKRIQHAAKKVFANLFTEALPSPKCRNPHLTAKVSGSTHVYYRNYNADANVILTFGNGDFIGRYTAHGEVAPGVTYDSIALENAYIQAFKQIAANILKEEKLSEYFNNGFTDALPESRF